MDYLIDITRRSTNGFTPLDTLNYINKYWFNRYYKMFYKPSSENTVKIDDGKMYVTGDNMVKSIADYILNCNLVDPELLEELEKMPKYIDGKMISISTPPKKFLLNVSNSCALDSLLSIIFFARGGYFVSRIADSSLQKFPPWIDGETMKRAATEIRLSILDLYNQASWKQQNIRSLQKQISVFLEDDCRDIKSVNEIWGTFCTMFDGLSFDLWTKRQKDIGNTPIDTFSIPIWENIFPKDLATLPYHLVYLNDTDVSNKNFADLGYANLDGYELVGVVLHGGGHYTSLINVQEEWYRYDDLTGDIRKYDGDVLKQNIGKTIVMMFYVKM